MLKLRISGIFALLLIGGLTGCDNMGNQAKLEPYERSDLLPQGTASQHAPPHTRTFAAEPPDPLVETGRHADGSFAETIPITLSAEDLRRGQDQYSVYCMPCHGYSGHGDGLVVQRGFPSPPSFHADRLRQAPAGYLFTVISKGYGVMLSYGARVPVEDRWRIIAYLRALQLSQHATAKAVGQEQFDAWASETKVEVAAEAPQP